MSIERRPNLGTWIANPSPPTLRQRVRFEVERRIDPWKLLLAIIFSPLFLHLATALDSRLGQLGTFITIGGFLACYPVFWMLYIRRATSADLGLLESEADEQTPLVEITFGTPTLIVGTDRGVIWIEANAVNFAGHRCSFSLPCQEFERVTHGITDWHARVILKLPSRNMQLTVLPIRTKLDPAHNRARKVLSQIQSTIDASRSNRLL